MRKSPDAGRSAPDGSSDWSVTSTPTGLMPDGWLSVSFWRNVPWFLVVMV